MPEPHGWPCNSVTTRGHVALAGTFGYELDITKLPEEERKLIPEQTAMYHKYHELIREGEYYRILSAVKTTDPTAGQ